LIAGCAKKEVSDDTIVATWGDSSFTVADFKKLMIDRFGDETNASKQSIMIRYDVLDYKIEREIKLAEVYHRGIDKRESILKICDKQIHTLPMKLDEVIEEKAIELHFNIMVRDRILTEEMIKDFFEHEKDEIRVRHILITTPENITGKDTLQYWQKINEIYDKAKSGDEFTKLVDRYSEDDSIDKDRHGDLGYFRWGRMVDEFQEAAWKLKPGDISPPVYTEYGYHIIKMLDRRSLAEQIRTSQIFIRCSRRADPAETTAAWERAMMILKKAKEHGVDFVQLARQYSEDQMTWVNGDVGFVPRSAMPAEYWDKVFTMKENQVDGPLRTQRGYHIIKVTGKRKVEKSLEDSQERDRIIAALTETYQDTLQDLAKFYVDSVVSAYKIGLDKNVMKLVQNKLSDLDQFYDKTLDGRFNSEELKMILVNDKLGGLKISDLVFAFMENPFPVEYLEDSTLINYVIEPLMLKRYLSDISKKMNLYEHPDALAHGKRQMEHLTQQELEREVLSEKVTPTEAEIQKRYEDYYLNNKLSGPVPSLEDVHYRIISDLLFKNRHKIIKDWYDKLKKSYHLQINKDVIKNIWQIVEPMPEHTIAERKQWRKERKKIGQEAKLKRKKENEINLKLKPGTTQTFRRDGKDIQVKIGQPRYKKDGKVIDPSKSNVKITREGKVIPKKGGDSNKPVIRLKPTKKDK